MRKLFDFFDSNRDGFIDKEELIEAISKEGRKLPEAEI